MSSYGLLWIVYFRGSRCLDGIVGHQQLGDFMAFHEDLHKFKSRSWALPKKFLVEAVKSFKKDALTRHLQSTAEYRRRSCTWPPHWAPFYIKAYNVDYSVDSTPILWYHHFGASKWERKAKNCNVWHCKRLRSPPGPWRANAVKLCKAPG